MNPLFLILSLFIPFQVSAVEPTPTQAPKQEVLDLVTKKVKEMLNQEPTTVSTGPKSFIGTISQKSDSQLTINYQNQDKIILVDTDTVVINAKKTKIKFSDLKSGQSILALGYLDAQNQLTAKRVIITDLKTIENNDQVVIGIISDISKSTSILSIIPIKNKNTTYQITTDSKTKIINKDNSENKLSSLTKGQKVIIIIKPDIKLQQTFYTTKIIVQSKTSTSAPTPAN